MTEKKPFWDRILKSEKDGLPLLYIKTLFSFRGRSIRLHKIIYPDHSVGRVRRGTVRRHYENVASGHDGLGASRYLPPYQPPSS